MSSRFRFTSGAMIAGLFLTAFIAFAQAGTGATGTVDPHHPDATAGNRTSGDGSKLGAVNDPNGNNTIVIQSPATGGVCMSITNNSNNAYFVPWNSQLEWNRFQSAVTAIMNRQTMDPNTPLDTPLYGVSLDQFCCQPQTLKAALHENGMDTICGVTPPNDYNDPNLTLGKRWLGVPRVNGIAADLEHAAAQGDSFTVKASDLLHDNSINFRLTLLCSHGVWRQSNGHQGSCTPANGACAPAYASDNPQNGFSAWLGDDSLCAEGSIMDQPSKGVVPGKGWWTWVCDGTGAPMTNATCFATNTSTQASCGSPSDGYANGNPPPLRSPCTKFDSVCDAWGQVCDHMSHGHCTHYKSVCTHTTNTCVDYIAPFENLCEGGEFFAGPDEYGDTYPYYVGGTSWQWSCRDIASNSIDYCDTSDSGKPTCGQAMFDNEGVCFSDPPTWQLCADDSTPYVDADSSDGIRQEPGWYYWYCTKPGYDILTTWCGVQTCDDGAPSVAPAACGSASNYPTNARPPVDDTTLCAIGDPSSVTGGGTGPWDWTCTVGNGTPRDCSAPLVGSGNCGPISGAGEVPHRPDYNLCTTGVASIVMPQTEIGPWHWTCGSNSGTCNIGYCTPCEGTIDGGQKSYARSGVGNGCSSTTTWNETDVLSQSGSITTIQWTDALGAYSQSVDPVHKPAPYCQTCFQMPQSVSGARTVKTCGSAQSTTVSPLSDPAWTR